MRVKQAILGILSILFLTTLSAGVQSETRDGETAVRKDEKPTVVPVHISKNDLSNFGVNFLVPGDPEFDAAAGRILLQRSGKVDPSLKAISVVIQNQSERRISGYAVLWTFTRQDGVNIHKEMMVVEPASFTDGSRSKRHPNQSSSATIPPDSDRLVSPSRIIQAETPWVEGGDSAIRQEAAEFSSFMEQSTKVSVALDGVFFEDGSFVGPDETKFFETSVAAFDTVQGFNRQVLELASRHAGDDEILGRVAEQRNKFAELRDTSGLQAGIVANEFLSTAKYSGIAAAIQSIQWRTLSFRPQFVKKGNTGQ